MVSANVSRLGINKKREENVCLMRYMICFPLSFVGRTSTE